MKKLFLFVLALATFTANATVHTVNNNANGGTAFKEINEAIAVAVNGDTIYVQGSPTTYAGFTLTDKKIVFVGPGFSPNKNLPQIAKISGGQIRNTAAPGSSDGTEVNGLYFLNTLVFGDNFTGSQPVNNIVIRRCRIDNGVNIGNFSNSMTNYFFESNYISNSNITGFGTFSNFIFRNNFFNNGGPSNFNSSSGFLLDHNLFYSSSVGSRVFSGCKFFTLTNNIFYTTSAGLDASDISFSTFSNNITFQATNNTPWAVADNVNSGGSNIANVDPKIVANAALSSPNPNPILDYSVGAGPAKTAGTDGKDIGLMFDAIGSLNWANARAPRLPFIFSMNITNPTNAPGVSLNVEVTAKKQN